MSKVAARNSKGQYAGKRSPWYLAGSWLVGIAALALVWVTSRAVMGDFSSFRSCNDNSILQVSNCGKHSFNVGDLLLIALLLLMVVLAFSLLTHAWRVTRRKVVI